MRGRLCRLLYIVLALSLTGCPDKFPKITVCVSDPEHQGFQCVAHDDTITFLKYDDSDNYIAFSPRDAETLLNYCRKGKQE